MFFPGEFGALNQVFVPHSTIVVEIGPVPIQYLDLQLLICIDRLLAGSDFWFLDFLLLLTALEYEGRRHPCRVAAARCFNLVRVEAASVERVHLILDLLFDMVDSLA